MLADLLPLMTDTVRQLHAGQRDLFGKVQAVTFTDHRARVTYSPGKTLGQASREAMPDAAATVWLIDHPHPIVIGDTFELPDAATLKVARLERRKLRDGVLHKVYLT
ncbi:hypothetical protein [Sphingomonas jeddahensis]|uniref:Uncharacterized protein n=1 Tax=Sphingomonas jeddahensis TaxID=1915074 RepID=A0A1V2ETU9_9SPHN|nr:hypothetical protein [Sphingomonas jeddahensis]ONF95983.1 hypothetical protein SPHI_19100 [Sphingomonas jeddahensis]